MSGRLNAAAFSPVSTLESRTTMKRVRISFRISREDAPGLVIIVLVGAIGAALILSAVHRRVEDKRARRTMSDMRAIATAVEAYEIDHHAYPSAPGSVAPEKSFEGRKESPARISIPWPSKPSLSLEALRTALSPDYIQRLPTRDPWGHPYLYVTSTDRQKYTIVSAGPDGKLGAGLYGMRAMGESDYDLVYANGAFVTWMEGT
jgi:type II secretory pathway pseudopilin PulG